MILRHFDNARRKLRHYCIAHTSADKMPYAMSTKEYITSPGTKALQLGCGYNLLPGWLNTDVNPGYGVTFMDVLQPFPLPDNSIAFILAEHLIETIPIKMIPAIIKECARVLYPGRVIKLSFYSSDTLRNISNSSDNNMEYIINNIAVYSPKILEEKGLTNANLRSIALNNFIHKFNQSILHDYQSIRDILLNNGFRKVNLSNTESGITPRLNNLRLHILYIPDLLYNYETVAIEATK